MMTKDYRRSYIETNKTDGDMEREVPHSGAAVAERSKGYCGCETLTLGA